LCSLSGVGDCTICLSQSVIILCQLSGKKQGIVCNKYCNLGMAKEWHSRTKES